MLVLEITCGVAVVAAVAAVLAVVSCWLLLLSLLLVVAVVAVVAAVAVVIYSSNNNRSQQSWCGLPATIIPAFAKNAAPAQQPTVAKSPLLFVFLQNHRCH